jgi:glycosyltransferase involved in cell wall biosynthesis
MTPPFDICMFAHNSLTNDGRSFKQAASLAAAGWRVALVGVTIGGEDLPAVETRDGYQIIRVKTRLLAKRLPGTWGKLLRLALAVPRAALQLRRTRARVYQANDFTGLLVVALAGIWRRPVVYDSRELFFDRWPKGVHYPLKYPLYALRPLEGVLARRAAAVITVSRPIAERMAQKLRIPQPALVLNAVDVRQTGTAHAVFPADGRRWFVHTGSLLGGRHLAELVAALAHLPPDVALALLGDGPLRPALEEQARALGIGDRLLFVPPVPVMDIAPTIARAGCAAVLTTPHITNNYFALPNKFFEAVAAGLPLVYSPIPEVERLAREYGLGVVCDPDDPRSIAGAVMQVLEPEANAHFRENARKARQILNWEQEEKKLTGLYRRMMG